jgi:inner membrane protein
MKTNNVAAKIIMVAVVSLILLVPLLLLNGVVSDRAQRKDETEAEIMSSWGGRQTLAGPMLTVPYISRAVDANGRRVQTVTSARFLPRTLAVDGVLEPETRSRGMYQVTVYTARLSLEGEFTPPDFSGIRVAAGDILWNQAYLSMELPDMRSLQEKVDLAWGGKRLSLRSGKGSMGMFPGEIRADVPLAPASGAAAGISAAGAAIPFSFGLSLHGGDFIGFLPFGEETRVRVRSPWASPNFSGSFLPVRRVVGSDGFDAEWRVISLARAYPQAWTDGEIEAQALLGTEFGVSLMTPVDTYLKVTRALKYGLLFLVLPFCTLFFFEILARRRVHPMQYLLIGLADCVFYLLLLSLAEHLSFGWAYLAASSACAALVTLYTVAVVRSRIGLVMLPVLGAAYGFLAVVLSSEDFALLMGALGLFLLLGGAMFLTRRVDWYRRDRGAPRRTPESEPPSPGLAA